MTRVFDIIFSLMAIIILLPFMIPIMIGLKLTGEHYIFYDQIRIGKGNKPFRLLKFATMLKDSPNMPGGLFTEKDDPRILPMGRFLRKTKINELPQLINILMGQMSLIGYRPIVPKQFALYTPAVKKKLKRIRPGLSGIGSIVFRNEEEMLQKVEDKERFRNEVIGPYKGELECWYAEHRSLSLYFQLIMLTVEAVLHPDSRKWQSTFKDIPKPPKELEPYL